MIGDLIVGGIIAAWALLAIFYLVRNRKKGSGSCGCNCSGCSMAKGPNVIIDAEEETCDCCRKE